MKSNCNFQWSQVTKAIDEALAHQYMAHGVQGVLVQSMDSGKVVYDHNGDMLLVPASNMKLIATAAALDMLGADYKVTTSLYASSEPVNGNLTGDLVVVGQGDPLFGVDQLQQMVDSLHEKGVKHIGGNIVGDDTWFDNNGLAIGWAWDDLQYADASQPSGLNVNKNMVEVFIRPGASVGDSAVVEIRPENSYMSLENNCVTGPAGSDCSIDAVRLYGTNIIRTSGTIPLGQEIGGPVQLLSMDEPTLFGCTLLRNMLEKTGIKVDGRVIRGAKPQNCTLISNCDSLPLREIVRYLNKPSDNFMAECLLKTLGKEIGGEGSYEAGIKVEYDWLKKIGVDTGQIFISDSSGLSRCNLVSPQTLINVITYMYKTKHYEIYANSLPIAGVDSHLKERMLNTPAVSNVKAKTGYLSRVCSLTGYAKTLAGENLAVSIIQNNHLCSLKEANDIQDVIFVAVSEIAARTE